jgi:hypothetical protein
LGHNHAASYWLPFFWGFDPAEYKEFIDLCLCAKTLDASSDPMLNTVEEEFLAKRWNWCNGTFEDYIKNQIFYQAPRSPVTVSLSLVHSAMYILWQIVDEAVAAREKSVRTGKIPPSKDLRHLHPRIAVTSAVKAVGW